MEKPVELSRIFYYFISHNLKILEHAKTINNIMSNLSFEDSMNKMHNFYSEKSYE